MGTDHHCPHMRSHTHAYAQESHAHKLLLANTNIFDSIATETTSVGMEILQNLDDQRKTIEKSRKRVSTPTRPIITILWTHLEP